MTSRERKRRDADDRRTRYSIKTSRPGILTVEAESSASFARHTHDEFGIGFLVSGAQVSASGRGEVEAESGDVITVNPGEVHDGRALGTAARRWRMLYVDPAVVAEAALDIAEGRTADFEFDRPVVRQSDLQTAVARLFLAATSPAGALAEAELLLTALAHFSPQPGRVAASSSGIRTALELIEDDPSAPLSLDDLARVAKLSRYQTLRGFARATGLTPHAYLTQRRLALAVRKLRRGEPLVEVALAAGFCDQSHFSNVFVRAYGVPPGVYAAAFRGSRSAAP